MPGELFTIKQLELVQPSWRGWLQPIVDLIFPPRCGGCGRVDTLWCTRCQSDLQVVPLRVHAGAVPEFDGIASTGLHSGKLQQAVQALKYHDTPALSEPLGHRLRTALETLDWTPDLVAPVPIHAERLRQRGYNQAGLLAESLARQSGLNYEPYALLRQRYTRSQVGLNRADRLVNVTDAFRADPEQVSGRGLLIVDDVYTTGATLSVCAQAALDAGATSVYGLTVTVARD